MAAAAPTPEIELTPQLSGLDPSPGTPVMVFMAGYADDHGCWKELAPRFASSHSLLVLCMPDYDQPRLRTPWGYSFPTIVDMMDKAIRKAAPQADKVTLVGHDWGSFCSLLYCTRFPDRVDKLVVLDVGLARPSELGLLNILCILSYQTWLAAGFLLYRSGIPFLPRIWFFLYPWKVIGPAPYESKMPERTSATPHPIPSGNIAWMGYPYMHLLHGMLTGRLVQPRFPSMPALFVYGTKKRAVFHGASFVQRLQKTEGCAVKALDCGHWVQVQKPDELEAEMRLFLKIPPTAKM